MAKKIIIGILILLVGIQLIRIDKTNPEAIPEHDFLTITNAPDNIATTIKQSCYDCHSNHTNYPWYSNVAPISWMVKHHVNEAREHGNFSEWLHYNKDQQEHIIEECVEVIENGEMPFKAYVLAHKETALDKTQREELIAWFKTALKPKDELYLNEGKKWLVDSITTTDIDSLKSIAIEEVPDGRLSYYNAKAMRLNNQLKTIFSNCVMEGEAHEQLHVYIKPLVVKIRTLEESETLIDAELAEKDILAYLNTYSKYFTNGSEL